MSHTPKQQLNRSSARSLRQRIDQFSAYVCSTSEGGHSCALRVHASPSSCHGASASKDGRERTGSQGEDCQSASSGERRTPRRGFGGRRRRAFAAVETLDQVG